VTSHSVLLVNPTSGKGKFAGAVDDVRRQLEAGGLDTEVLIGRDADEAADLARKAVEEGIDQLIVMGGDGMVHLAAQIVAYTPVTLGVIATGSGNDVARYLGLPRRSPAEAAEVILRGRTRTIDLANAGGTYYVTVLAAGFDSLVNERANTMRWPTGQMRYNLATLAELRVFRPLAYTVEADGIERSFEAMVVAVGNGPSYGGGLRICEGASLEDGLLDVVVIKPISRLELVKVYPRLFKGTHVTHPAYEHLHVRRISLASSGIVAYADGERISALPLTVDVAPAALTLFVP
jgi:diacylglycerol kinase (ATP)